MTDHAQYIHGTERAEQARLRELNRLTNAAFVAFLSVPAHARVLEVGSGLGVLASDVARSAPDVRVVGLERARAQLAACHRSERVSYARGDAVALPFADGQFEVAYARYVLEHVGDPVRVLSEMRRVVRSGGYVAVQENDISLSRIDPPCPRFDDLWQRFARIQTQLGGDPFVGRALFRLFRAAGFTQIELSVQPEIHWAGAPGFTRWIENLIGNLQSARDAFTRFNVATAAELDTALDEIRARLDDDTASATFVWNRARALKS